MRGKFFCKISLFLLLGLVFVIFEPSIHKVVDTSRSWCKRYIEYYWMHRDKERVNQLKNIVDEEGAWYTKYHVIAHSGGGINGKNYTNSREAWEYHYSHGTRVFDADLQFTFDSVLVLRHEWNDNLEQTSENIGNSRFYKDQNGSFGYKLKEPEIMDYKTFKSSKINYRYTPQSVHDLIYFMKIHPDVYIATDLKCDNITRGYRYLLNCTKDSNAIEVLDRIIVNVYTEDEYKKVIDVFPFKNVSMRQYIHHVHNYADLASFCVNNNIHVVSVSACYAKDEGVKWLHSKGIRTYVAVVDYLSDMRVFQKFGFDGCISNYLDEDVY